MSRSGQLPDVPVLLRIAQRLVTAEDVAAIQAWLTAHPSASREALARHLCQVWEWRCPGGSWNIRACRTLLRRLGTRGLLTLPPPRSTPGRWRARPPLAAAVPLLDPTVTLARAELQVRLVGAAERPRWRSLLAQYHYLGFRHTVGEALAYVATLDGHWVALVAWAAAALKSGPRDRWIGWTEALRVRRLHLIANNVRFLILPGAHLPNLASRILATTCRRLSRDWQACYGHPILLAETFVDPTRFAGTCYRAAGWQCLGLTRGFGRQRGGYVPHGTPKRLFVRPLCPDAVQRLTAPFPPPRAGPRKEASPMLDVNGVPLEGEGGLLAVLRSLPDPRKPRGVRHPVSAILATATCACLAGARSVEAIAQWAAELSREAWQRLGGTRPRPPSEPTFRRVLQRLDAAAFDRAIGAWLATQPGRPGLAGKGIAVDGKTLRGAHDGAKKAPHLLSAVLHEEGLVLAQRAVEEKTNEIPHLQPLLQDLDLTGAVVTADALHTQVEPAKYLVETQHVAQVFRLQRTTTDLAGHPLRAEIAYGITSLNPGTADPARLLALSRAHWAIENKVHWVRDVTFDEDRSRVRKHAGAHVMASLRNLALSLLRLAGAQNIARALRRCGWERTAALRLIGIALA